MAMSQASFQRPLKLRILFVIHGGVVQLPADCQGLRGSSTNCSKKFNGFTSRVSGSVLLSCYERCGTGSAQFLVQG